MIQSLIKHTVRTPWVFLVIMFIAFTSQSRATPTCNYNVSVDSTYGVEQTICFDDAEHVAYVDTTSNYTANEWDPYYLSGVSSEVTVYNGTTTYDSGMQYGYEFASVSYSGSAISAQGYFEEWLTPMGLGNAYGSWYGPYSGASVP